MLKLNVRRRWRPWADQGKDGKRLLSPLTSSRRTELLEQATESPDSEKNPRRRATARLNQKKYQDLVADECVHGWEGLACDNGEGTPDRPLLYSAETAHDLMNHDLFNVLDRKSTRLNSSH